MIRKFINKFLKSLSASFSHYKRIFHIFKGFNTSSFSAAEGKIKSIPSQLIDYLYLFFVLKILPSDYHLFCLDIKNRKEFKRYIGNSLSDPYTMKKLSVLWENHWILVKDKLIFKLICEHHKIPVPTHIATFQIGMENCSQTDLGQLMLKNNSKAIVLKPRAGRLGKNIHIISSDDNNISKRVSSLQAGEYIAEQYIKQHSEMDKINPHSVNSIRIITFLCPDSTVEILGAMLRTSSSTLPVDNFTMGGIAVGIDMQTGRLRKEGFVKIYSPQKGNERDLRQNHVLSTLPSNAKIKPLSEGKILTRNPVTNKKFFNFQLPYWSELKEITINAQKVFYHIKSIGWDVAIASKGPVIIEGNTIWGTTGFQAANGGILNDKNKKLLAQYDISFYR